MLFSQQTLIIERLSKLMVLIFCACSQTLSADTYDTNSESKRIEVYSLSQNYWDTQYGETLGEIVLHLLPNNPAKQNALRQDIVHLNSNAFIGGNADKLLANKRLWLPGYMTQTDSKVNPATTTVETYSWGNIKRQKN